jgi:ABC transporter DrrB family efflux protein
MSAAQIPTTAGKTGFGSAFNDGVMIGWRNLKRAMRIPELAVMAVIQSIMFVLLFAFVFGKAIPLPGGGSYREFLLPGIFAQTVVFASAITAVGITDDVNKGLMDRFRSLPMARSAVLTGRAIFDQVYNALILVVLMLSGLAVGWRPHCNIFEFIAGVILLMLFVFAMSWVGIWLGLTVRTVESANQVGFTVLFPLTFITNIFVPLESLPSWLRPIAEWNPVSTLTGATRDLWGNPNPYTSNSFPAEHPVILTLIWIAVIIAIFAPMGVRKYRNLSR